MTANIAITNEPRRIITLIVSPPGSCKIALLRPRKVMMYSIATMPMQVRMNGRYSRLFFLIPSAASFG